MRWILREGESGGDARDLAARLSVPEAIAGLLIRRGYESEESAERFLRPRLAELGDPFEISNLGAAVDCILRAIDAGKRIVLYGDYDVDGVTAVALLSRILNAYGANVGCFVPTRETEGYGLSEGGLKRCFERFHAELLIAVDCGTSNASEIRALRQSGVEVIVVDHHEGQVETPECEAFINPKVHGGLHYLCSVGLAFKVAHGLMKRRRLQGVDLKRYLDLVALGTLADLVPLRDENRILVKRGLEEMGQTQWLGLRALMDVSGVAEPVGAADVGFKLGPRVNAAGRLGSAEDALELLLTENANRALDLAKCLNAQNQERREVEEKVFLEAESQWVSLTRESSDGMDRSGPKRAFGGNAEEYGPDEVVGDPQGQNPPNQYTIVVGAEGWNPGVVGIAASRMMRKYHRPTVVVAFDASGQGRGSGRSIPGLSLVEALEQCSSHLLKFGGHEMAAGVSVQRGEFELFRAAFESAAKARLHESLLVPTLEIDAELRVEEVNIHLLELFEKLSPFGMGNPNPVFVLRRVLPNEEPRWAKERHLQLNLKQGRYSGRAIWFNASSDPLPPPPWDIAFEVSRNEYRGVVSAQILVRALRASEPNPGS